MLPTTSSDVEAAVREALENGQPLEIVGHGTRRSVGHAMATNAVLDLSALSAVLSYEPQELLLTVEAGARLADVEAMLAANGQEFAFEPISTSRLLGTVDGLGTIGGMVAAGLAGPRRIKAGAARDHLLGFHGVSGFGEMFKAGGKVVKNVTGYDLCKLVAGSWGTLTVMTEITLKVMPKAEAQTTLLLRALDPPAAVRAMSRALGSPFDVSGAAYMPVSLMSAQVALGSFRPGRESVTLLRLEGVAASVAHRGNALRTLLKEFGDAEMLDDEISEGVWRAIRDVAPFAADGPLRAWPVWRIVCPPAAGGDFGLRLARETGGDLIYDWGGGLIWAALPPSADAHAAQLRSKLDAIGGHATLVRAPAQTRASVDVFHPQTAGLAALNRRVKQAFDPSDIFNRGRLVRRAAA